MKICIITLHHLYNYGSVLQAYATQRIFEEQGCEVEIVDYLTSIRTPKHLIFGEREISLLYRVGKALSILFKEMTIGRFIRKRLKLSKRYITVEDLDKTPPKADIYITGSDQTWNSTYNKGIDRGFFLDFISEDADRIAFVSSFGKDKLDEYEIEQTREYLKQYRMLSVREDSAVSIIKSLGLDAIQLIDPTLQIQKSEWAKIASNRLIKDKYLILMLLYQEDNHATEYARKIADEKGLKLVKLSWELKKPNLVDRLMTHRTPEDFLSLFYYADFVVTNSFHGCAFSINLEKEFIVIPRSEYNTRIESLLRLTGLQSKMVNSELDAIKEANNEIEYTAVREKIEVEREHARKFVECVINR